MTSGLTRRQRQLLELIESLGRARGVSPSILELASLTGLGKSTVHEHLLALERKGALEHSRGAARTWQLPQRKGATGAVAIPIVGRVAAGGPILAEEEVEGWLWVSQRLVPPLGPTHFALRVRGESMIGAHILDGDLVIVRQQDSADDGDIVVALIDDEAATVKRLKSEGGVVRLVAENPEYPAIEVEGERVRIQGKVVGLCRTDL